MSRVCCCCSVLLVCAFLATPVSAYKQEQRTLLTADGLLRSYLVYLPSDYDSQAAVPYSVIFYFHGYGGRCGADRYFLSGLDRAAPAGIFGRSSAATGSSSSSLSRFIHVQPCALQLSCTAGIDEALGLDWSCRDSTAFGMSRWNAGELCCQRRYDDGAFVAALVQELAANYRVDANKMFVTGFSNGCMFTEYLMCNYANLFAGGACSSGALMLNISSKADTFATCDRAYHPRAGVKFLKFHGEFDGLVPFTGGPHFVSAAQDASHWASRNNCSITPTILVDDFQHQVQQFPSCSNNADIRFCICKGLGHSTPFIFESYILDFFLSSNNTTN